MAKTFKLSEYRVLCFDVYGTLIDWEKGILGALKPLVEKTQDRNHSPNELLKIYHRLEVAQQQETPDLPYSKLLSIVYGQFATELGVDQPSQAECDVFGGSVGSWPAFPDTVSALRRLSKHYKLVVLSNTDRDSFRATNAGPLQGVPFDLVITAHDVGSYKPALRNFEYMLREVKERLGFEKSQILQTAQSQLHDHHPARKMDIRSVWIERPGALMGSQEEEIYDWRFKTLGDMADSLEKEGA